MDHLLFTGHDILVPAADLEGAGSDCGAQPQGPVLRGPLEEVAGGLCGDGGRLLPRREFLVDGARYAALMLDEEAAEVVVGAGVSSGDAAGVSSGDAAGERGGRGPTLRRVALREALALYPNEAMRPALRGAALLHWLETARFCGACGSPLADKDGEGEDAGGRFCAACGRVQFPRISPAVIVLIRKGERALLAHNARFRAGFFGLIAGFVEAGETLEEAAIREARGEAGVEIEGLRYVKSQPWPFPDSLMVAFTAEWKSGEAKPDGIEISELRWCLPAELPNIPPKGSVARYLIDEFVGGKEG
jgi:NADH pyrophosphatase NudC (nudix superfamily)